MTGAVFLSVSENVAFGLLVAAVVLAVIRLCRGPTLPDRVLALDMLTQLAISLIGILALQTHVMVLVDVALALCLVGFVATVALARFVQLGSTGLEPPASAPSRAPDGD